MNTTDHDFHRWRDRCRTCAAPILWAVTHSGKPMPINPAPAPERGNLLLALHNGQLIAGTLRRNQAAGARDNGLTLYASHFTDCPHADTHRRTHTR